MTEVPAVELADGSRIPQLGLGTWLLNGRECERAVARALELGYRHVDTAEGYRNEREVGRALAGADRASIWLTSKVWRDNLRPADLREACERSLRRLATDYLDLLLIHWPNADIAIADTVEAFRSLRDEGRIRAWGVSNFTTGHMKEVCDAGTPATNQVELHPFFNQTDLVATCAGLGVPITAYSPLARGRVTHDPTLAAIGARHGRTPAQVALRWSAQHGFVVIPKAADERHLRENLQIFDFRLEPEDMRRIDALPQGDRLVDGDWSEFDRPT